MMGGEFLAEEMNEREEEVSWRKEDGRERTGEKGRRGKREKQRLRELTL